MAPWRADWESVMPELIQDARTDRETGPLILVILTLEHAEETHGTHQEFAIPRNESSHEV